MTKKKLRIIIIFSILALYLISLFFIELNYFTNEKESYEKAIANWEYNLVNEYKEVVKSGTEPSEYVKGYLNNHNNTENVLSIPYKNFQNIFAIVENTYNESTGKYEKQILFNNLSFIYFSELQFTDNNTGAVTTIKDFYLDISDYIDGPLDKLMKSEQQISNISLYKNGDSYIPISITYFANNTANPEYSTIELSDFQPNITVSNKSYETSRLHLAYSPSGKYVIYPELKKLYNNIVLSEKADAEKEAMQSKISNLKYKSDTISLNGLNSHSDKDSIEIIILSGVKIPFYNYQFLYFTITFFVIAIPLGILAIIFIPKSHKKGNLKIKELFKKDKKAKAKIFAIVSLFLLPIYLISILASFLQLALVKRADLYSDIISQLNTVTNNIENNPNDIPSQIYSEFSQISKDYKYTIVVDTNPSKSSDETRLYTTSVLAFDAYSIIDINTGSPVMKEIDKQSGDTNVYFNIEDYLTDNVKAQINAFIDAYNKDVNENYSLIDNAYTYQDILFGCSINYDELTLYKDGGNYIPVAITISSAFNSDIKATINFTDHSPEYKITSSLIDGESSAMSLFVWDKDSSGISGYKLNKTDNKTYRDLFLMTYTYFNDPNHFAIREFYQHIDDKSISNSNDKLTHYTNENYQMIYSVKELPNCNVYIFAGFNLYYLTLKSYGFMNNIKIFSVLYILTTIALWIAISIFHDKNKRLNDSKLAFVSAASHELKTPLAIIQNQTECVMENIAPDKNDQYIKSIYDESLRMNNIITKMLQYNKLSNASHIEMDDCSLSDIVKSEVQKYSTFAETNGVKIETDICEFANIKCNYDMISMAIDNFISNAIKYATGDKTVKVTLLPGKKGNTFEVSVFNTCDGISDELSKDLWDLLTREDKARNSKGQASGMGLAINKRIFELHGFKYGFENIDNGVKFRFITAHKK